MKMFSRIFKESHVNKIINYLFSYITNIKIKEI